jgi:hypothetical protein
MPVNTFNSGLRVETNVGGEVVDNDEYIAQKNNWEHSHHPTEPWQRGYQAEVQEELLQDILMPKSDPIEPDPALLTANRNDLKIKGFHQP